MCVDCKGTDLHQTYKCSDGEHRCYYHKKEFDGLMTDVMGPEVNKGPVALTIPAEMQETLRELADLNSIQSVERAAGIKRQSLHRMIKCNQEQWTEEIYQKVKKWLDNDAIMDNQFIRVDASMNKHIQGYADKHTRKGMARKMGISKSSAKAIATGRIKKIRIDYWEAICGEKL